MIFSGPNVRALFEGRKTQTRRVVRGAPPGYDGWWHCDRREGRPWFVATPGTPSMPVRLPCEVGDRLWVRERWATVYVAQAMQDWFVFDAVDNSTDYGGPWQSPIHMPRAISRLTLLVTDVRVQRLQDISRDDVIAEGLTEYEGAPVAGMFAGWHQPFAQAWDVLHGDGAWDRNPWIAASTFTVHRANIDRLAASATEGA